MLTIKNWDKIIGVTFLNGEYICDSYNETPTDLIFSFITKYRKQNIWVKIEREGEYDSEDGKIMYIVTYPNCSTHKIGAEWFGDMDNVKWTFEQALNSQ